MLNLVVEDVGKAATDLKQAVASLNGLVTSEDIDLPTPEDSSGSAEIVVSVPADQLDAAIDRLSELGEVKGRTIQTVDVTDQVVDIDSRVKTMRESISRLQELISRAGSVSDIAAVERELTERQANLESLLAQQAALSQRVDESLISVSMWTPSTKQAPTQSGFLAGLQAGWESMIALGKTAATVFGALLPYLVLAVVIGVPVFFLRRLWRRKHPKLPPAVGRPAHYAPYPVPVPTAPVPTAPAPTVPVPRVPAATASAAAAPVPTAPASAPAAAVPAPAAPAPARQPPPEVEKTEEQANEN
jgi:hypothetical protein